MPGCDRGTYEKGKLNKSSYFDSDDDDLQLFQNTLPPSVAHHSQAVSKSPFTLSVTFRYATAPIRVSSACRLINSALTGPKAQLRDQVNEEKLKAAWEALERCWEEFDGLLQVQQVGILQKEDSERFVSGWKVCPIVSFTYLLSDIYPRGPSPSHHLDIHFRVS